MGHPCVLKWKKLMNEILLKYESYCSDRWTFAIALAAPLVFFALKLIHP